MAGGSDRTERPTTRKRRKARRKGQVPRSRDLAFAFTFTLTVLLLGFAGSSLLLGMQEPFRLFWQGDLRSAVSRDSVQLLFLKLSWSLLKIAGPWVALVMFTSLTALVLQGGWVISGEPLRFKPEKLNPANNIKKVFSKAGIVQMAKSLILVAVVLYLSYYVIRGHFGEFSLMAAMDLSSILNSWGGMLYEVGIRIAICLIVMAAGDLAFQRYSHEESLKMTKQEVKDEFKETEGNPTVKGRIRRLQLEMARRRMMAAVAESDVVVTNPTHFAVALKFDMETMAAPQVVAKGQDYLALRIRKVAEENKVPLFEEVQLARTLYKTVEVGEEIPVQLYRAVAQILACVYKLKKSTYR